MNNESRNLRRRWTEDELIVILDMYFCEDQTDSHKHDEIARLLGRYNPKAKSYQDGAINRKLGEIKGLVESSTRRPLHPGNKLVSLIEKYKNQRSILHAAALEARRTLSRKNA